MRARSFWPGILEDLNERLPKQNIWITELAPTFQGKPFGLSDEEGRAPVAGAHAAPDGAVIDGLFIRGLYLSNPKQQGVVFDYFRNLAGSSWFKIEPHDVSRVIKPGMPTNTEWAFPYELRLPLRTPLSWP